MQLRTMSYNKQRIKVSRSRDLVSHLLVSILGLKYENNAKPLGQGMKGDQTVQPRDRLFLLTVLHPSSALKNKWAALPCLVIPCSCF